MGKFTYNTIYRWYIIKLYTWNLLILVNVTPIHLIEKMRGEVLTLVIIKLHLYIVWIKSKVWFYTSRNKKEWLCRPFEKRNQLDSCFLEEHIIRNDPFLPSLLSYILVWFLAALAQFFLMRFPWLHRRPTMTIFACPQGLTVFKGIKFSLLYIT